MFVRTMAHDLRTPISAMQGFAELALETDGAVRQDMLRRINVNAERLTQVLASFGHTLTAQSQPPSPNQALHPERLDLQQLVHDVVATISSAANGHGPSRIEVHAETVVAVADRGALERILENLLSNALKYSSNGPICVSLSYADNNVRIAVTDHGRGIHLQDLLAILQPYERGRLAKDDGGTGLGLASV